MHCFFEVTCGFFVVSFDSRHFEYILPALIDSLLPRKTYHTWVYPIDCRTGKTHPCSVDSTSDSKLHYSSGSRLPLPLAEHLDTMVAYHGYRSIAAYFPFGCLDRPSRRSLVST